MGDGADGKSAAVVPRLAKLAPADRKASGALLRPFGWLTLTEQVWLNRGSLA